MYTNSSCTLYIKSKQYKKIFIPHCFFTRRKSASYNNIGIEYQESAFVMFKANDIEFTEGEDFVIEGECDIEIYNSSEEKQIRSLDNLMNRGAHTIMQADVKNFGSGNMRHVELSCK